MKTNPFKHRPLLKGEIWDARVSAITEYGAFVKMGSVENHLGLIHISSLAEDIIQPPVSEFIENVVGPVGSRVRVKVQHVEFKGSRRVQVRLIEVLARESIDEVRGRALERHTIEE